MLKNNNIKEYLTINIIKESKSMKADNLAFLHKIKPMVQLEK